MYWTKMISLMVLSATAHLLPGAAEGMPDFRRTFSAVEVSPKLDLGKGWRLTRIQVAKARKLNFRGALLKTIDLPTRRLYKGKGVVLLSRSFLLSVANLQGRAGLFLGAHAATARLFINGREVKKKWNGPPILITDKSYFRVGLNSLDLFIKYGKWQGGLKWRGRPRFGPLITRHHGFFARRIKASTDGLEQPIGYYVPKSYDGSKDFPLIVALHGWNGDIYSFIYMNFLDFAERENFLVIFPHARGNSLYVGKAEIDLLDAIKQAREQLKVNPDRIYLTGFSMGGAGATTLGYHYPHLFAAVASYAGDCRYGYRSYRKIFKLNRIEVDRYSVVHFAENALSLPVMLIHGKRDRISHLAQSTWLDYKSRRLSSRFNHKIPLFGLYKARYGHEEELMHVTMGRVFRFFKSKRRIKSPYRVRFKSNSNGFGRDAEGKIRPGQFNRSYWVYFRLDRDDIFGLVDIVRNKRKNTITIKSLKNVSQLRLDLKGAGLDPFRPLTLRMNGRRKMRVGLMGFTAKRIMLRCGRRKRALYLKDERVEFVLRGGEACRFNADK